MQELQLNRGLTTGRLDARFSGPTYDLIDSAATYDPQEAAITGAFVAAFNMYMREDLKFNQDRPYHVFADFKNDHWDWKHEGSGYGYFPGAPSVVLDLANAIITNPKLQVQMQDVITTSPLPSSNLNMPSIILACPKISRKIFNTNFTKLVT
jgi:carboxypeptidase C (cathepsin A)